MDKYALEEYDLLLQKDEDLKKLIGSIELSEGSLLNIIFVKNAKVAQILKIFLHNNIEEEKTILPTNTPLTYDEYIKYFFEPLKKKQSFLNKENVLIFDLTFLDKERAYDTEKFFIKLNEIRNYLMDVINRPIILIVPENLKKLFINFAHDVWSIRTIVATIQMQLPDEKQLKA